MTKTSKIILIGAALAVAVIGAALVKRGRQTNEPETSIPPPITARSATTGDAPAIEAVSSSPDAVARKLPKLIDLGADKCIPCKMMAPILEELKKQYAGQLEVEFIDVWKNPGAARTYGVQMIPTQIFYDADGKERFRHVGFYSKEDIVGKWKELGVELK